MEAEDIGGEIERAGVTAYLKDALAVLLEVRPADPLLFLTAYFKHASQPDDLASLAWYLIRACPRSRPCFRDNLYSAFSTLARQASAEPPEAGAPDGESVATRDVLQLLRALCRPLPGEVAEGLLARLPLPAAGRVRFSDFAAAAEACLAAEEALRTATELFDACDRQGRGSAPRDRLLAEVEARRRSEQQRRQRGPAAAGAESGEGGLAARLGDVPPQEALRAQLAEFEAEDGVTAEDFFVALWRLWCAEEGPPTAGPQQAGGS